MDIGVDGLLKRDDVLLPIPLTIKGDCGVEGRCCVEEFSSSSSLNAV
jgi:hypothetical protein